MVKSIQDKIIKKLDNTLLRCERCRECTSFDEPTKEAYRIRKELSEKIKKQETAKGEVDKNEVVQNKVEPISSKMSLKEWKCGWITPDGDFYGCHYQDHKDLAKDIFEQKYSLDSNKLDVEQEAENQGWLKFGWTYLIGDYYFPSKKVTQAQKDTLFDWCKIHNKKYPKVIMDNFRQMKCES